MICKSFKQQLQSIFSLAGYKSTGLLMPCKSEIGKNQTFSYRIDIAHQIYRRYKQDDFKFSEKGVTPQTIAEEIAVFTHKSQHFRLTIDSFGYIFVTPSLLYYQQMKQNIVKNSQIVHFPVVISDWDSKIQLPVTECILFSGNDLSLSTLRLIYHLELICRKKITLREQKPQNVIKLLDLSKLNQQDFNGLVDLNMINLKESPFKCDISANWNINRVESKLRQSGLNYKYNLRKEYGQRQYKIQTACFRHQYIQFLSRYSYLIDEEKDNIIKFGQIFPNISLQSMKTAFPLTYIKQINKIMKYTTNFDSILPINLRQSHNLPVFPFSNISKMFEGRKTIQVLLLLLDTLGDDNIIQIYHLLPFLSDKYKENDERKILQLFNQSISQILI